MRAELIGLAALGAAAFAAPAMAFDDYGAEVSVATAVDLDSSESSDTFLSATSYIFGITYKDIPRAEAEFLSHASNVSVQTNTEADDPVFALELYGEHSYFLAASDGDVVVAKLGFFAQENMLFTLGLQREDIPNAGDEEDDTLEDVEIAMKWVPKLGKHFMNIEAEVVFIDDEDNNEAFGALAEFYFNQDFSVGASVGFSTFENDDNPAYGVGARYFVIPTASIELGFGYDPDFDNSGVLAAGLTLRF